MGFEKSLVKTALSVSNGNPEEAIQWLLNENPIAEEEIKVEEG